MSYAYLSIFADIKYYWEDNWVWAEDDDWMLFPPFFDTNNEYLGGIKTIHSLRKSIWTDFHKNSGFFLVKDAKLDFFDYEYIYEPKSFLFMEGGKWETFRKNRRKWPKQNPNFKYVSCFRDENQITELLLEWLISTGNKKQIEDEVVFYHLILMKGNKDVTKRYLVNDGKLIGINVYDFNWKYINYRICINDPKEKYSNEFLRWLFFTSSDVIQSGKQVNDGGCLDNPNLEKFKDKLNPIEKRKRHSIILT